MSDRGERFTWDASQPLGGRHPEQLLRLFSATDVKAMMQKSLNMKTALDTLRKELRNHLGKAVLQKSIEFANQQRMLPPECALALRVYTRNEIYGELNQALREDSGLEEFYHLCICLVKALALLPPHKGSSYRRMNDVEEQVVRRTAAGKLIWTWAGFTSTSVDPSQTAQFGSYLFRIHGVYGRDISAFSCYPKEQEVLFVPGTMLRVLDINSTLCDTQEHLLTDSSLGDVSLDRLQLQLSQQQMLYQQSEATLKEQRRRHQQSKTQLQKLFRETRDEKDEMAENYQRSQTELCKVNQEKRRLEQRLQQSNQLQTELYKVKQEKSRLEQQLEQQSHQLRFNTHARLQYHDEQLSRTIAIKHTKQAKSNCVLQ